MPWLLSLTACAHQGELTVDDRMAIRAVIERQLEAFRQEDAAAAFALASPEIQAKYGSPENFMTIVKTCYEPVYRPRRMGGFTKLQVIDGQPTQPVLLVGPDGDFAVALYTRKTQVHGEWKILRCANRTHPSAEPSNALKQGMSQQEILRLFGNPHSTEKILDSVYWYYADGELKGQYVRFDATTGYVNGWSSFSPQSFQIDLRAMPRRPMR